jgi:hypothetical protein
MMLANNASIVSQTMIDNSLRIPWIFVPSSIGVTLKVSKLYQILALKLYRHKILAYLDPNLISTTCLTSGDFGR